MRRALVLVLLWLGALAAPAAAESGPWGWPLAGPREVARPFVPPASAYGTGHRGADLPSVAGAAVRASASGRVTYAGLLAGRGVVVVTHGALRTTYEPVSALVDVGQAVALGEVVGRLAPGHLGCPVEACLHWGLRRGEEYLDPVRLVERGPVRLLPMDRAASGAGAAEASGGGRSASLAGASKGADRRARGMADGPAAGGRTAGEGSGSSVRATAGNGSSTGAHGSRAVPVPPPAEEPSWSVRASEAPLGVAAVAALALGIGLLARPAPTRPGPPRPPAAPSGGALTTQTAWPALVTTSAPPHVPSGRPLGTPSAPVPVQPVVAPPPPAPSGPVSPSAAPPPPAPGTDVRPEPLSPVADVLELSVERARRRPA